jgi:hypothetical protein
MRLASKVLERAAERCTRLAPASALLDDDQRTEMLAEALASQLLRLVGIEAATGTPAPQPDSMNLAAVCADQIRRNQTLARALGACDCWGELPSCDACGGLGVPGWRRPEAASFNRLVHPVVIRMELYRRHRREVPSTSRPNAS